MVCPKIRVAVFTYEDEDGEPEEYEMLFDIVHVIGVPRSRQQSPYRSERVSP
jgi:hypothetical protein